MSFGVCTLIKRRGRGRASCEREVSGRPLVREILRLKTLAPGLARRVHHPPRLIPGRQAASAEFRLRV